MPDTRYQYMKTFIIFLFFFLSCNYIFSQKNEAVVSGTILNPDSELSIMLVCDLIILPSDKYFTKPDENGNFKFKIPISRLRHFWLEYNSPLTVPLLLDKGDSIFVRFDAKNKNKFPEAVKDIVYSGTGVEKNKYFYLLYKNHFAYQDSIFYIYGKKLDPFDFLSYCNTSEKKEKERILKGIENKDQKAIQFALLENELLWSDQKFQYSAGINSNYEGPPGENIKRLDSLGYFKFLDSIKFNTDELIETARYGHLVRNYFNYFYSIDNKIRNLKTDNEKLEYLQKQFKGDIGELLIIYYINYCLSFGQDHNIFIEKYVKNKELKARLLNWENL
jgi:hypothetical protein